MKRIFLVLSVLILLFSIYLLIMNFNNVISVNLIYSNLLDAQSQAGLTESGEFFTKSLNLSLYSFLILLGGIFVGAGTVYMFLAAQTDKVKAYQRELERTSISGSSNASKVEVLEAKIKTLEKAFNTVIDERTKLEIQIKNLNEEIDNLNNN
ncbi:hypothetical protein HDR58_09145 [bacterium]|nr:hypothetical protein [bacterium]